MNPDFIVVGGQKCGTTPLRFYLNQHPEVHMEGELQFFSEHYKKGVEWYQQCFNGCNGKTTGEKTPEYMYFEEIPERIYEFDPKMKLIFLFRDPVKRTFSQYLHNRRRGLEPLGFKDALGAEAVRLNDMRNRSRFGYVDRSLYGVQVARYLDFFSKDQCLFLLAEDLYKNRMDVVKRVCDFIGVSSDVSIDNLRDVHVGGSPRTQLLAQWSWSDFARRHTWLSYGLLWLNTSKKKPVLDEALKKHLTTVFQESNWVLHRLTGLDLSVWGK